jgi:ribonuclease BN (tRNA processing enzyme)
MHPDHIAMLASYVIARMQFQMSGSVESGFCHFVSPESVRSYMEFSELGGLPNYDQPEAVPEEWMGLKLSAMRTNHPKPNYCYKLQTSSSTLVWTGDTSYSDELAEFCRGADVLVAESSCPDASVKNAEAWGHMTPSMTARLIETARPALTVCSHFVEIPGEAYVQAVQEHLQAPVRIQAAFDGMEVELAD